MHEDYASSLCRKNISRSSSFSSNNSAYFAIKRNSHSQFAKKFSLKMCRFGFNLWISPVSFCFGGAFFFPCKFFMVGFSIFYIRDGRGESENLWKWFSARCWNEKNLRRRASPRKGRTSCLMQIALRFVMTANFAFRRPPRPKEDEHKLKLADRKEGKD